VLLVCTPAYARKASEGSGGVGYERLVVTGEMAQKIDTTKFICVLRRGDKESSLPAFANSRLYVNFCNDDEYEAALDELLRDIHNAPRSEIPPIGSNPFISGSDASNESSAELAPIKFELDPLALHSIAENLLRRHDLVGWKRLVRTTKKKVTPLLSEVRSRYEGMIRDEMSMQGAVRDLLKAASPLILLAMTAVDSEIPEISDQRSLLDELISIEGWHASGQTVVVELPRSLGLIYHHLIGALLVGSKKYQLAIDLITTKVADRYDHSTKRLWVHHDLAGWNSSFGGDCSKSWSFLTSLHSEHIWIQEFFSSELRFKASIRAYVMLASLVEFSISLSGVDEEKPLAGLVGQLYVPPMFMLQLDHSSDKPSKVLSDAVPNKSATDMIARVGGIDASTLRAEFKQLVLAWIQWHSRGGRYDVTFEGALTLP